MSARYKTADLWRYGRMEGEKFKDLAYTVVVQAALRVLKLIEVNYSDVLDAPES